LHFQRFEHSAHQLKQAVTNGHSLQFSLQSEIGAEGRFPMNEQEKIDRRTAVVGLLGRHQPLSKDDLQELRESTVVADDLGGGDRYGWLRWRMDIELIDAILQLNASSTRLAIVGWCLTVIGVALAALQSVARVHSVA
jgi:hypothetical protein